MFSRIRFFLMSLMAVVILVACAGGEEEVSDVEPTLADGVYFAISESLSEDGWYDYVSFKIEAGIVVNIDFNGVNEFATMTRKSSAEAGLQAANGERFDEQAAIVEEALLAQWYQVLLDAVDADFNIDDALEIDMETFAELTHVAFEVEPIERGDYIDGFYNAGVVVGDELFEGFTDFVNLFVKHGRIIAVHWNGVAPDGTFRYDPLVQGGGANPAKENLREQAFRVERFLLNIQDPMQITFDEDGIPADIFGVDIEVATFVSLVLQALADGPLQ